MRLVGSHGGPPPVTSWVSPSLCVSGGRSKPKPVGCPKPMDGESTLVLSAMSLGKRRVDTQGRAITWRIGLSRTVPAIAERRALRESVGIKVSRENTGSCCSNPLERIIARYFLISHLHDTNCFTLGLCYGEGGIGIRRYPPPKLQIYLAQILFRMVFQAVATGRKTQVLQAKY